MQIRTDAGKNRFFLLPSYSILPLAVLILFNMLVYFGSRLVTTDLPHYSFATPLDARVPYLTGFIWIYIGAYLQWIAGFIIIGRGERHTAHEVFAGELIAKGITLLCFLLIPTLIVRQEVPGTGLSSELVRWIYRVDAADNLFPSVHCLESWICFRGVCRTKDTSSLIRCLMLVGTFLVCISTVMVRQHVLVDIAGGILAAEAGLWLSRRFSAGRIWKFCK